MINLVAAYDGNIYMYGRVDLQNFIFEIHSFSKCDSINLQVSKQLQIEKEDGYHQNTS